MKAKKLIIDTQTGKEKVEEFEFKPNKPVKLPKQVKETEVDFKKLAKLLVYAEEKGWIR